MGATIAVIGLGRIGAFHAETLSGLAGVDELVVTDERPEVTAAVADKLGARAVPDAQAALAYVAASGGIFRDCSVHDFDLVCWIVGREVVEVYATGTDHGEAMFAEAGDAATAQTLLSFDDGTLGVVSNTRYNGRGYDCRLELHGSTDSVVAGWDAGVPVRNLTPGETFPHGAPYQFFMDRFIDAYRAELNAFLEVATGRRASPCTPQEALEVAWIAEAATLSLQQHRPIRMEEVRS